jgi:hypothetical protein
MDKLIHLFKPTIIAEWVTFIVALHLLPRRVGVWRFFVLLLSATLVVETIGWYSSYIRKLDHNSWIFNLFMMASTVFWLWIFRFAEPMAKAGKLLRVLKAVFICFGFINLVFFQGFQKYNWYTEVLGDVEVSAVCCYFFYVCLQEEEFRDLFRYEYFWLANGLLFSSLGSAVLYIFLEALYAFKKQTQIPVYDYINSGLNFLLYGSMIIAFICRNRNTRSSPG